MRAIKHYLLPWYLRVLHVVAVSELIRVVRGPRARVAFHRSEMPSLLALGVLHSVAFASILCCER